MKILSIISAFAALAVSAAFADETFAIYDTNSDKTVTYEELARVKKLEFDNLDRNRDQSVSIEEFTKLNEKPAAEYDFFHSTNFETEEGATAISLPEYGEQIRQMINRLDTTADNAVSEEEFAAAVTDAKAKAAASATPMRKGSGPKPAAKE